jgi:hypothetical protein
MMNALRNCVKMGGVVEKRIQMDAISRVQRCAYHTRHASE